jgi:hypothetical protein
MNSYSYYDSLDLEDAKFVISEEKYWRRQLGYAKLSDRAFKCLKEARKQRKLLIKSLTDDEKETLSDKTIFNLIR